MTSEEIRNKNAVDLSERSWMKEICLQLALLNEKANPPVPKPISRGPGRAA
jgi:hypothetical protein